MSSQTITLQTITVAGGVDYLMKQLLVVKQEQDTTGLSLPQKPRPSAAKSANCTPPFGNAFESLGTCSSSSAASTTTPTDEKAAPQQPPSKEPEVDVFEGDGELPDEKSIWLSGFNFA